MGLVIFRLSLCHLANFYYFVTRPNKWEEFSSFSCVSVVVCIALENFRIAQNAALYLYRTIQSTLPFLNSMRARQFCNSSFPFAPDFDMQSRGYGKVRFKVTLEMGELNGIKIIFPWRSSSLEWGKVEKSGRH